MYRLVTVIGPAGIGKTAVALKVAEDLIPAYEHGVWLVDFAPISDPALVPTALASALNFPIRSGNPMSDLTVTLQDKRMMLLFDNCEHLIEAAAGLAVELICRARDVYILATSREACLPDYADCASGISQSAASDDVHLPIELGQETRRSFRLQRRS